MLSDMVVGVEVALNPQLGTVSHPGAKAELGLIEHKWAAQDGSLLNMN